jgi:hypothetical protein
LEGKTILELLLKIVVKIRYWAFIGGTVSENKKKNDTSAR